MSDLFELTCLFDVRPIHLFEDPPGYPCAFYVRMKPMGGLSLAPSDRCRKSLLNSDTAGLEHRPISVQEKTKPDSVSLLRF